MAASKASSSLLFAMPLYEPTIPYRYVTPLIALLREHDPGGAQEILAASGMDGVEEIPSDSSLPMAYFDRLLTLASLRLRRSDLGFELGRRITIENHGTLGQVLKRCTTLQELLMLMERSYHLVTPTFAVRYVPGNRHCEWRIRVAAPMTQTTLHMFLEIHAVSMHAHLWRLLDADATADIYLSAPPPPHLSRYKRLPYIRFHFSSGTLPEVRCVLPVEVVRRPLSRSHGTDGTCGPDIRAMPRSGLRPADSYGEWIGLMLREAQTVQPTLAELAGLVNLSPRTLARKLSAEGINFRHLSTQIRYARACTMLAAQHSSIHQIAYQLGYSDATAFIRAFRRAGGITPASYRDRNG